jgi:steroid Delta-isomerase
MELQDYVAAFNQAVRDGSWMQLAAWFTDDAVLEFVGPPVGPFVGKRAIAAAYAQDPPDDAIELTAPPSVLGDEISVRYRWCTSNTGGTMHFTERGGRIQRLTIVFD